MSFAAPYIQPELADVPSSSRTQRGSKTHRWLNELMLIMGWQDRHRAYLAMRVTLHALRDRLTVEEVRIHEGRRAG